MICHHYRCIFIHIPKNAGQSIEHVFLNLLDLNWETRAPLLLRHNDRPELGPPTLAHLKAGEYVRFKYLTQEMFDDYFKFTIVRNPWTRMVSIYKYLRFDKKCDFKTFLMGEFKNRIFEDKNWFVGPQSDFLYNDNGDLLVDYIGRFEDLQNSFDHVCKAIGLPPTQVPHINEAKDRRPDFSLKPRKLAKYYLQKMFAKTIPVYKTYQEYYDRTSMDFVAEIYSKDIDLFSYKFE
ncbi:MAG: sulfotransferase family protein [Desulfobacteraceae bacterium]|nr:sulfotransferase family protein [Desulfobacteraceae bacterium]